MPYLPYRPGSGLNLSILDFRSQEKSSFGIFYLVMTIERPSIKDPASSKYGAKKRVFRVLVLGSCNTRRR